MSYNLSFMENGTAIGLIRGIQDNIPSFIPLILLFEFLIISIGGSYSNSRRTGYTNFIEWGAFASLITTTSAFFLGGIFVEPEKYAVYSPIPIICITVTILFVIGLLIKPEN